MTQKRKTASERIPTNYRGYYDASRRKMVFAHVPTKGSQRT